MALFSPLLFFLFADVGVDVDVDAGADAMRIMTIVFAAGSEPKRIASASELGLELGSSHTLFFSCFEYYMSS